MRSAVDHIRLEGCSISWAWGMTLKVNRLHLAASALAICGLPLSVATEADAQTNSGQSAAGGILGLFGTIAQEAAKSNARKKWDQTTPDIKQCVNTMFAAKNISVDQIIAAGIAPNDPRISQLVASCQVIMTTQPKTNFPCNVTNSKGQQVATTCNESFAKEVNGSLTPISRDEFLRAAGSGEQVQVANFETVAAQNARLAGERKGAESNDARLSSNQTACAGFYSYTKQDYAFSIEVKSEVVKYQGIDFFKSMGDKNAEPDGTITFYLGQTGLSTLRCYGNSARLTLNLEGGHAAKQYNLIKTSGDIFKYAEAAGWEVGD